MTPDQKATFDCLESVINEPRQDGLLDTIRLSIQRAQSRNAKAAGKTDFLV